MDTLNKYYNKGKELTKKVVYGSNDLPPNVKRVLDEVGDATITGADIGRTPVQAVITGIIKMISSTPYEKLFHLFIILHTTKGDVLLEKNERINMSKSGMPSGAESIRVPNVPNGLTINQLVNNTASYMGNNFIPYAAGHNNCQDFQMGILNGNHMETPDLKSFVKQDTTEIFKNPTFRKFAHSVTDIAGAANTLFQGGELNQHFRFKNNELNNKQIDILMRRFKITYHGCFVKDQLPRRLCNGVYIINLNGSSHWTALIKNGPKYFYFDSFGFPAPEQVEDRINGPYTWSDQDIQSLSSSSCGWFCVAFCRFMVHHNPNDKSYKLFLHLFYKNNLHKNEAILESLLK